MHPHRIRKESRHHDVVRCIQMLGRIQKVRLNLTFLWIVILKSKMIATDHNKHLAAKASTVADHITSSAMGHNKSPAIDHSTSPTMDLNTSLPAMDHIQYQKTVFIPRSNIIPQQSLKRVHTKKIIPLSPKKIDNYSVADHRTSLLAMGHSKDPSTDHSTSPAMDHSMSLTAMDHINFQKTVFIPKSNIIPQPTLK